MKVAPRPEFMISIRISHWNSNGVVRRRLLVSVHCHAWAKMVTEPYQEVFFDVIFCSWEYVLTLPPRTSPWVLSRLQRPHACCPGPSAHQSCCPGPSAHHACWPGPSAHRACCPGPSAHHACCPGPSPHDDDDDDDDGDDDVDDDDGGGDDDDYYDYYYDYYYYDDYYYDDDYYY